MSIILYHFVFNKTDADATQDMNENKDEKETEKNNGNLSTLANLYLGLIFD